MTNNDKMLQSLQSVEILPQSEQYTKILQTVQYGSAFEALEANFFLAKELLKWLTTVEITITSMLAYKAVCIKIPIAQQYIDNQHFLTLKPNYTRIANCYGQVPVMSNGPLLSSNTIKLLNLICIGAGTHDYIYDRLDILYGARIFPYIKDSGHEINKSLIESDWTAKFRYNTSLVDLILIRVAFLKVNAPLYYQGVVKKAYAKVVAKLYKEKLLPNTDFENIKTLNEEFPNIIDPRILNYDSLCLRIFNLPCENAGYYLGFPIHQIIPSQEQIHMSLKLLQEIGIERYVANLNNYIEKTYQMPSLLQNEMIKYANNTDVLYEEPNAYFPFDVIAYQTDVHIYRFTRREFNNITETKRNPWTNEWLPVPIYINVVARNFTATELKLPQCESAMELLIKLRDGMAQPSIDVMNDIYTLLSEITQTTSGNEESENNDDNFENTQYYNSNTSIEGYGPDTNDDSYYFENVEGTEGTEGASFTEGIENPDTIHPIIRATLMITNSLTLPLYLSQISPNYSMRLIPNQLNNPLITNPSESNTSAELSLSSQNAQIYQETNTHQNSHQNLEILENPQQSLLNNASLLQELIGNNLTNNPPNNINNT